MTASPAATSPATDDIAGLSFEQALQELETIVRQLEAGDAKLDESVALYARGDALRAHCEARLNEAKARIEQISRNARGEATGTTAFDSDARA